MIYKYRSQKAMQAAIRRWRALGATVKVVLRSDCPYCLWVQE